MEAEDWKGKSLQDKGVGGGGGQREEIRDAEAHLPVRLLVISPVTMNIYERGADYFSGLHLNNHEYVSMHLHLM